MIAPVRTKDEQDILNLMGQHGMLSIKFITKKLNRPMSSIRKTLLFMERDGRVCRERVADYRELDNLNTTHVRFIDKHRTAKVGWKANLKKLVD